MDLTSFGMGARLVHHDVCNNRATLAFQGSQLKIDVAMLGDDFPFKIDALFQFIGDLQRDEVRVR
jgi:hypothetical protein